MLRQLNVVEQCREYKVGLWSCPHFLFLIMGVVIIAAMLGTYLIAQRYAEPEVSALIVLTITAILFIIGNAIIKSFEHIANASHAKAEFVSIISHQLRSPLTAMKWQLEMLLKTASLPERPRGYLEGIDDANEKMIRLVNDLLEVNRIEDDRLTLRPTAHSLVKTTKEVITTHQEFAKASNVTITLDVRGAIASLYADETRMRWVVENLVDNAIRYSDAPGTVAITIREIGNRIRWSVTNTGVGINKEETRHIFTKFFRASTSLKLRTEGSGLGLFIAKSIVEASGGAIGFVSLPALPAKQGEANKETTFWFTVPIKNNLSA